MAAARFGQHAISIARAVAAIALTLTVAVPASAQLAAEAREAVQSSTAQASAAAQASTSTQPSTSPQSSGQQGPLVLQPIHNDFVITPDFKFTQILNTTGELLGGYAGVDFDRKFLVGGAGYWLIDPTNVISMGYGGVLFGWRVTGGDGPVRLDLRGLVGGGSAYLNNYYGVYGPGYVPPQVDPRHPYYPTYPYYGYYYPWFGFFVTEPEARVQIALGQSVAIDAGVSYRVVAAASGFESQLRGAAGTIGVRFSIH